MESFDIIVVGMGPGGEHVANTLAERGLRVLGVDHGLLGGECPYWGCIPTKMMVRAADALAEARRVDGLAGSVADVTPDWSLVARRIRDEATDGWDDQVAVERFTQKGGTFLRGTGRVVGPGRVDVDGRPYAAGLGIVVNAGSRAATPPIEGLDKVPFWTNHEFAEATALPGSLVVLGGGAIGCELAQVAARFGTTVTVVESAPRLLSPEEPEASERIATVFEREGITVHVGSAAATVAASPTPGEADQVEVTLEDGTVLRAERLLVATGRRTDPGAVGLGSVGVAADARVAPTDEWCRVAPGVWAVGDITGKGAFTHVSMYQAAIVVRDVLGEAGPLADYRAVPRVTFTDPEVATVGLTEAQARDQGVEVRTGFTALGSTTRGWIHGVGGDGFIKLVADPGRGLLVGATVMGPAAGEVIGALAVAVHAEVPLDRLRSMIYAYPTFHRGIEDALADLDQRS
ncbi:dihydrolipoyl dehydrogenase family protein [Intrasporangium calvum]|uniref:dihydrolipoyl dehydrogenase family protein n=1 Tax=Intrasporangium calvum TaxID=53358 RepID=UPI000DF5DB11|nr:NAD(P)/FAD-dependent oxidoreductase [Intrasporangium calvum]AXG15113.1 NAD(P)/FAD-dependent oxidoreductase [Intrasporangium calvum]